MRKLIPIVLATLTMAFIVPSAAKTADAPDTDTIGTTMEPTIVQAEVSTKDGRSSTTIPKVTENVTRMVVVQPTNRSTQDDTPAKPITKQPAQREMTYTTEAQSEAVETAPAEKTVKVGETATGNIELLPDQEIEKEVKTDEPITNNRNNRDAVPIIITGEYSTCDEDGNIITKQIIILFHPNGDREVIEM